jgi:hypothetical protein
MATHREIERRDARGEHLFREMATASELPPALFGGAGNDDHGTSAGLAPTIVLGKEVSVRPRSRGGLDADETGEQPGPRTPSFAQRGMDATEVYLMADDEDEPNPVQPGNWALATQPVPEKQFTARRGRES